MRRRIYLLPFISASATSHSHRLMPSVYFARPTTRRTIAARAGAEGRRTWRFHYFARRRLACHARAKCRADLGFGDARTNKPRNTRA